MTKQEEVQYNEQQIFNSYKQTLKDLENLITEDEALKSEVFETISFLTSKFVNSFSKENEQMLALELINDVLYKQIAHGFWLVNCEITEDEKATDGKRLFPKDFWKQPRGTMRNSTIPNLQTLFNENWYMFKGNESINLRILNELNEGFETYRYAMELAAGYGGYLAFTQHKLYKAEHQEKMVRKELQLQLGDIGEVRFVTPEIYIMYDFHNDTIEQWHAFIIESSRFNSHLVGSVYLLDRNGKSELNVSLENIIKIHEKSNFCKRIVEKLAEGDKKRLNSLQMRVQHLSEPVAAYDAKKFLNY